MTNSEADRRDTDVLGCGKEGAHRERVVGATWSPTTSSSEGWFVSGEEMGGGWRAETSKVSWPSPDFRKRTRGTINRKMF